MAANGAFFSIYIIPLLLLVGIPLGKAFPSPPCIYLFTSVWTHEFLFYAKGCHWLLPLFILMLKIADFGQGELPRADFSVTLTMLTSLVEHFLTFGALRWPRLIVYISRPEPRISPTSKEARFLSGRCSSQNPASQPLSDHCHWSVIAFKPSQGLELGNMCMHTHIYTLFIRITLSVYIERKKWVRADFSN